MKRSRVENCQENELIIGVLIHKRLEINEMIRIAFIRHGITAWNKEGRAQGSSDIPLDADGHLQAEKLAERLGNEKWDIIFSSDLRRAEQTAEAIQTALNPIHLQTDARIREVSGGQIEGTTLEERIAKWGNNWREQNLGMESNEHILRRGFSFLEDLTEKYADKNIIVVSHGSFIKRIIKKLLPDSDMDISLGNCSLTILRNDKDTWELELHNCLKHLAEDNEYAQ